MTSTVQAKRRRNHKRKEKEEEKGGAESEPRGSVKNSEGVRDLGKKRFKKQRMRNIKNGVVGTCKAEACRVSISAIIGTASV